MAVDRETRAPALLAHSLGHILYQVQMNVEREGLAGGRVSNQVGTAALGMVEGQDPESPFGFH